MTHIDPEHVHKKRHRFFLFRWYFAGERGPPPSRRAPELHQLHHFDSLAEDNLKIFNFFDLNTSASHREHFNNIFSNAICSKPTFTQPAFFFMTETIFTDTFSSIKYRPFLMSTSNLHPVVFHQLFTFHSRTLFETHETAASAHEARTSIQNYCRLFKFLLKHA